MEDNENDVIVERKNSFIARDSHHDEGEIITQNNDVNNNNNCNNSGVEDERIKSLNNEYSVSSMSMSPQTSIPPYNNTNNMIDKNDIISNGATGSDNNSNIGGNINNNNNNNNNVGIQVTFDNISYKVENKKYKSQLKIQKQLRSGEIELDDIESHLPVDHVIEKELTILSNVSGIIEKGEMLALMGPSGSGKSTLLDILANRKSTGTITGKILVNGKEIGEAYKKYCAYVTQEEILLETATVYETLKLHADLRLPGMSEQDKVKRVKQVLKDVGLEKKINSKIGGILPGGMTIKGLSGGEKKRVSIGCALVTNPSLVLLDEPTSGLDSLNSLKVMKVLLDLTISKGVTIVCSVHQPRPEIYHLFNKIMIVLDGKMIYSGSNILEYLTNIDPKYQCPQNMNPADWILDVCSEISHNKPQYTMVVNQWENIWKQEIKPTISDQPVNIDIPKGVSWFYQYKVLQVRSFQCFYRNSISFVSRLIISTMIGLIFVASFGTLGRDGLNQNEVFSMSALLFFISSALNLLPYASISTFISNRTLFNSERASKIYHPFPYFFGSMLIEIISAFFNVLLILIIIYTISHLKWTFESFVLSLITSYMVYICSTFIIITFSNLTGSIDLAFTYTTGVSLLYLLFAGFLTTVPNLPISFRWIHYLDIIFYSFASLVIIQFKDVPLECPSIPTPCLYPNGNDIINHLGLDNWKLQETMGILLVWIFFFYFTSYFALSKFNKEKR